MKARKATFVPTMLVVLCLGLAPAGRSAPPATAARAVDNGVSRTLSVQTAARANPEIDRQRRQAEQDARKAIDQEAVASILATRKAVSAIAAGNKSAALSDIEAASGKVNILLARNPSTALIPEGAEVDIIDTAPADIKTIRSRAADVTMAVDDQDYPAARVILDGLISELRVRTYNLPLATYPDALKTAARLLDQNKPREASVVLSTALNTQVIVDRAIPLPVLLAQAAVAAAEVQREKDRATALQLLSVAKSQLDRARELGYAGKDPQYASLNSEISGLERQIKGNGNTKSAFAQLEARVSAFFHRLSGSRKRA